MDALSISFFNSTSKFEREHVTQYIHRNKEKFKIFNIENEKDLSYLRWTIDTAEDFLFAKEIYNNLYKKNDIFLTEDIIELLNKFPKLSIINNEVQILIRGKKFKGVITKRAFYKNNY